MGLLKDSLMKENLVNFLADIPAYAFIAYANFLQVMPHDYPAWEFFFLKHGWLILLLLRLCVAGYDFILRLTGNYWIVDQDGKPRRKSFLQILKNQLSQLIR